MLRILVVEDDPGIYSFLQLELEHEGFDVVLASTGRTAVSLFSEYEAKGNKVDLLILDIMLPELNGIEVLRRIRKISNVPIILLTARSETYDKIVGLDAGADDYLTKPFEIEELLARIRTVMRRTTPALSVRELTLNTESMEVIAGDNRIALSKTEFMLLKLLLEHKNEVLSRDFIISKVWGENHYIEENSVDVYVRYLRSKIDEVLGEKFITTVRGAGYIIRDEL
ncbi:MAG TPA: response regulator transcription factor [Treponemataceae bacterium]|nr:response regulator transcription factor [Treponemataceae bacterium]